MIDGEVGAGDVLGGGVLIDSRPGDFSLSKIIYKKIFIGIFFNNRKRVNYKKKQFSRPPPPHFKNTSRLFLTGSFMSVWRSIDFLLFIFIAFEGSSPVGHDLFAEYRAKLFDVL